VKILLWNKAALISNFLIPRGTFKVLPINPNRPELDIWTVPTPPNSVNCGLRRGIPRQGSDLLKLHVIDAQ